MTAAQKLIDKAVAELKQTTLGYTALHLPETGHWDTGMRLLAQARATLDPPPKPPKPKVNLGPVIKGGVPILLQDLTHVTDGMTLHGSVWPAFDDGFGHTGMTVIAPEPMVVNGHGHSLPGESLNIAVGASGIEYWIGHLADLAAVGTRVKRGGRLGVIAPNSGIPHVHFGINAISLLGHDLDHLTGYRHGAAKVGAQLKKAGFG